MPATLENELSVSDLRHILEGLDYGELTRDELEHALKTCFHFPVEEDDRDTDLIGYLEMCLNG